MILGGVDLLTGGKCRILDELSPDNNALLASETLLSGDTVHYIQPLNNGGKLTLECFNTHKKYKTVLALSQAREPVFLNAGTELIPVLFDYAQNPCVKWADTRKLKNPPSEMKDFFTVHLIQL